MMPKTAHLDWQLATGNWQLPLAAGFVTWGFVAAGVAAMAIPIVIHILNRRRFKTVTWAAMEFLLRAMRKNRRRLRFEQWVLLATRCAVVVLLGMALARPLGCESATMAVVGGRTGVSVLVIDNSYSMAYEVNRPGGKTHLDNAKRVAKELVDRASREGGVAVILAGSPARAVVARPSHNPQDVKNAIDRVEQSYGGTDLPGALQLALQVAKESQGLPDKSLYLFTDATASAWRTPDKAAALAELGPEVARVFRVSHHNLSGGEPQANGAVLDARPQDNLVTTKFPADFAAAPKGFGNVADATVSWKLNDQPLGGGGSGPLKLTPDTGPLTQPQVKFPAGGPQVVSVALGGGGANGADKLRVDDTRYRVVDVAAELKVLIVEGQRGIRPEEGSGFFLREALSPPREAAPAGAVKTNSYVDAESINYLELGNKILDGYAAVVMANVAQVPPTQAEQLERYAKQGGTVFWFMGDQVAAGNYNDVLLPRKLIPGPLVKQNRVANNQKGYVFDVDPKSVHPYLRAFANTENSGLNTVEVYTYWQVDLPDDGSVNTILNYLPSGGTPAGTTQPAGAPAAGGPPRDPAFTVHGLGEGKVVFCSTSAGQEWTTFPGNLSYISAMHELLSSSVRTGDWWLNLDVGEPLTIPPAVRLPAPPTLTDPAGRPVEVRATQVDGSGGGATTVYKTDPLRRPGVYMLQAGLRTTPVAVNVPAAAEADVRTVPSDAIREALGGIELTLLGPELPVDVVAGNSGNDLSWAFMLAVLALLGLECVMAMHFGHYRRVARQVAGPSPATGSA